MKPKGVTTQMKALSEYFLMLLFVLSLKRVHVFANFMFNLKRETWQWEGCSPRAGDGRPFSLMAPVSGPQSSRESNPEIWWKAYALPISQWKPTSYACEIPPPPHPPKHWLRYKSTFSHKIQCHELLKILLWVTQNTTGCFRCWVTTPKQNLIFWLEKTNKLKKTK